MNRRTARTWLLEGSLAAGAVLLGLFFTVQSVSEGDGAPVPLEAAAGLISVTGLLLFRRTRPVTLTLALIPLGITLGMPMGVLPFALFSVALHRPARVTVAVAALHAVAVSVFYGLALGLTRTYYETVAFLVLLHVSLVAVAMLIRAHRLLVASWAERARQAEEGQRLRIEQARLAEREQIAREMHDVLAHRVSLLALHAGALEVRRDASADERQAAGVIRQCAHDALEDLRMLLGMLRAPAEDRPQPTLQDVPALVEQTRSAGADVVFMLHDDRPLQSDGSAGVHPGWSFSREIEEASAFGSGWEFADDRELLAGDGLFGEGRLDDDGAPDYEDHEDYDDFDEVPDQTGRHAYRIIQEALTNALKHAPGSPVRVKVDIRWFRGLDVRVDNDLVWERADLAARPERVHAEAIPGAGAGLAGLRERVQLVGGKLEHGPTASGEFNLRAWLPWNT